MYQIKDKTYNNIINKLKFLVANMQKGIDEKQVPLTQRPLVKIEIKNTNKLIKELETL